MLGAIAGDIIGSPYIFNNISGPSGFVGWNLFEQGRQIYFTSRDNSEHLTADEFRKLDKKKQLQYKVVERTYDVHTTHPSYDSLQLASFLINRDSGMDIPDTLSSTEAVAFSCGDLHIVRVDKRDGGEFILVA